MRQMVKNDSLCISYDAQAEISFITKDTQTTAANGGSQKDDIRATGSASVRISYCPTEDIEFIIHEAAIGSGVANSEIALKFKLAGYDFTLGDCKIAGPVEDVNIDGLCISGKLMENDFNLFAGKTDVTGGNYDISGSPTEKGIMLSRDFNGVKMNLLNVNGATNKTEVGVEGMASNVEYEAGYDFNNSGRRYVRAKFADIELEHTQITATGANEKKTNKLSYDLSNVAGVPEGHKGEFELRFHSSVHANGNKYERFGVRGALPDDEFEA